MTNPRYTVIYVPGLDGTQHLRAEFMAKAPADVRIRQLVCPTRTDVGYEELTEQFESELRGLTNLVLLGESYGGPLAIKLIARGALDVRALVLSASFVTPPRPAWLKYVTFAPILGLPPPNWFLRTFFAGREAPDELLEDMRAAGRECTPAVLALRTREVLGIDVTREAAKVDVPALYLKGRRDHLISKRCAERVKRHIPHLRIEELDAPHLILQTRGDEAWRLIDEFVQT